MTFGLTEVMLFSLLALAWKRAGKKGVWTKEREDVYKNALEYLTDPDKLNKMAETFDQQGFPVQANMLRKRAELRSMTAEKKKQYHEVRDKALASDNVEAILKIADAFEAITATGEAERLRKHAKEVQLKKLKAYDSPPETQPESPKSQKVIEVKAEVVDTPAIHGE